MSKVAWVVLRTNGYKKMCADPEARAAYFEELRAINRGTNDPPLKKIRARMEKEIIGGVDTWFMERGRKKAVIYLHGGSYCEQPVIQHWQFCDRLTRETDATVIFPLYKMAPDYTFETAYVYLTELWERMLKTYDADRLVLMGDSAGGGLALAFAEYLKRETALPQPGQIILFSPWLDLSMETEIPAKLAKQDPTLVAEMLRDAGLIWAGGTDLHDYRLSPIFGDLKGLAPMTVYVGTHEIFLPDSRKFRERCLREEAQLRMVEEEKMNHVYALYPIPEARKVQAEVFALINAVP